MFGQSGKNSQIRLPFGFRDIFPVESGQRNAIREVIRSQFKSWGYGEVKTPVMEYTENISIGVGGGWKEKLINFIDIDGSLISLRADMTIPIARLAGMRLRKDQLPARFSYFSDVFRQAGSQAGNKRVFSQAGLEFIGSGLRMQADAEIMIILTRVLKKLGLEEFRIAVGHIGFIEGLFRWLGLDSPASLEFKKNIIEKDFVRIDDLLKGCDSARAGIFKRLIRPGNDLESISGMVSDIGEGQVLEAFEYLEGLYQILEEHGLGKYLVFDFSIIRDFDYYTGLLFEVYCRGITGMIGSGGRYDSLIKKFGSDMPATGFALDIDVLHDALGEKDISDEKKIMLGCRGPCGGAGVLMGLADKIRKKGIDVEILFDRVDDMLMLAREKGCSLLVIASRDLNGFSITDTRSGKSGTADRAGLMGEVDRWRKD
jgi:ATP phosphoribosyltransferase regulatory subunit